MTKVLQAKKKDLGDNFVVRRSIPVIGQKHVGPFIFWDHMGPANISEDNPMLVRSHPHIGLATLTYLFDGEILHRDSLNNELLIRPGEVNWMTAGNGIVHSERSENPGTIEGIQLWVALPKDKEEIDPAFEHYKKDALPILDSGGINMTLIAGEFQGQRSPVAVYSPLAYLSTHLKEQEKKSLYRHLKNGNWQPTFSKGKCNTTVNLMKREPLSSPTQERS